MDSRKSNTGYHMQRGLEIKALCMRALEIDVFTEGRWPVRWSRWLVLEQNGDLKP
jgi:hypothetical protein